jgi:hypothetical protein
MESSRTSLFLEIRALAAAAASGNRSPLALDLTRRHKI